MKLEKKKALAAKTLGVGKDRIIFNTERLAEIKEAITKQDIRDLFANKSILIKEIKGRKTVVHRRTRRRAGSIRHTPKKGKAQYVILTRKLRNYLSELKGHEKISAAQHERARKEIKASIFKSKSHMKQVLKIK